ncbi:MAG TPA: NYN domain-containing protein [Sphingomonas sp.]|nr:NYN domain-containing protein [Sphingomonas sp.]
MSTDHPSTPANGRHIALLIDADNVSHTKIGAIVAELSKYGTANIRRAYGDWASQSLKGWKDKLHAFAIRPVQQFSYSAGKNATDIAIVIDAMELLYTQKLDGFAIASSDADFTPLIMALKANGQDVFGFGERKTPEPFVNACSTFLYLDSLVDPDAPAPAPAKRPKAAAKPAPAEPAAPTEPVAPTEPERRPPLAQDAKLVTALRGGVEAAERDDGWALLSTAGSRVKRQAPIDPRNYGVRNFPALFEAVGLFDIVKGGDGHAYIADKRNRERTAVPTV